MNYAFDAGGRVNAIPGYTSTTSDETIRYAPSGGLTYMKLANGLVETREYNARLQPELIQVGTKMKLQFTYGTTNNNGNVRTQTITRDEVQQGVQSYSYDGVNRLQSAAQTGTIAWSQGYWYDVWGNRAIGSYGGVAPDPTGNNEVPKNLSQQAGNTPFLGSNRISTFTYDNAGNVTNFNGVRTAEYDAENRQVLVRPSNTEPTVYAYDGDGRRIKKTTCPPATVTCNAAVSGAVTTTFVYDASGQLAAEYGGPAVTDTGRRYLSGDHLGSTRLVMKADGTVDKTSDYLPFGEELTEAGTVQGYPVTTASGLRGTQRLEFTSKERDAETGLDYFGPRYYSSAQGRFTSPDEWAGGIVDAYSGGAVGSPGPLPYADITDPQTINKYAYVRNNPMRYTDPDGHCPWCIGAATSVITGGIIRYATGQDVFDAKAITIDAATGAVGAGLAGKAARLVQLAKFGNNSLDTPTLLPHT